MLALALLLAWGGRDIDLHSWDCRTGWCQDRAAYERAEQTKVIEEQLDARPDCTKTPHLSKTVLVTEAKGRIGDGLGMVSELSFDEAYKRAGMGEVWVLRFCG